MISQEEFFFLNDGNRKSIDLFTYLTVVQTFQTFY